MILLLGSSGCVGRELLPMLIDAGLPVRAGYRRNPPALTGCEFAKLDIVSGQGLDEALEGVRDLFLLAAHMPDQTAIEIGVVERAVAAGVERIVKLSCVEAPAMAYSFARIHRPVEEAIEQSGLAHVFLRPESFMQNFLNDYAEMVKGGLIRLPCGDLPAAHIDARDIARAAAAVLQSHAHDGAGYDLTGPAAISLSEICGTLSAVLGQPLRFERMEDAEFEREMASYGVSEKDIAILLDMYRYIDAGHSNRTTDAVEQLTGRPATPFARFAEDYKAHWK